MVILFLVCFFTNIQIEGITLLCLRMVKPAVGRAGQSLAMASTKVYSFFFNLSWMFVNWEVSLKEISSCIAHHLQCSSCCNQSKNTNTSRKYKHKHRNCADVCRAAFQGDWDKEGCGRNWVWGQVEHAWDLQWGNLISYCFFSSDRSSYSDSVLLLVRGRQLFQILSISANIFSFSFWELNADW